MSDSKSINYRPVRTAIGYIQAEPRPTVEQLAAHYSGKYYQNPHGTYQHTYSADELTYFKNVAFVTDYTARRLGADSSVFDVGCGEGFFASALLDLGWSVQCCDFSGFGLEHFNPSILPIFRQGDAYSIIQEFITQGLNFGLINLQNVLEHVLDPVELLVSLKPLIRKNAGCLRIRVPNDFSRFQLLLRDRGATTETWFCPPEHLNYFDETSLKNILQYCGYSVMSLQADFPIELFLSNPHSNYWQDRAFGKNAHLSRVLVENFLIETDVGAYVDYASAAGRLGFGRELIVYARPV